MHFVTSKVIEPIGLPYSKNFLRPAEARCVQFLKYIPIKVTLAWTEYMAIDNPRGGINKLELKEE